MNQNNKFIGYLQHGTKQQPIPHRQQQPPRRRAGAHHGRLDRAAGFPELGLQGRVERHDRPEHVRGVPRRPVRLQLRPRQQHRSDALRRPRHQRDQRRRPRLAEQAAPQPVHGRAQLLQGQLRRRLAQPQVRRRVPRRVRQHPLGPGLHRQRDPLPEQRRADRRPPLRSAAPARRTRWRRPASSSPTPGRSTG